MFSLRTLKYQLYLALALVTSNFLSKTLITKLYETFTISSTPVTSIDLPSCVENTQFYAKSSLIIVDTIFLSLIISLKILPF